MAVGNPAPTSRAKVGPDKTASGSCLAEYIPGYFVGKFAGFLFKALCCPGNATGLGQVGLNFSEYLSECNTGYTNENIVCASNRFLKRRFNREVIGKWRASGK